MPHSVGVCWDLVEWCVDCILAPPYLLWNRKEMCGVELYLLCCNCIFNSQVII